LASRDSGFFVKGDSHEPTLLLTFVYAQFLVVL
jgi:hypothetical protein